MEILSSFASFLSNPSMRATAAQLAMALVPLVLAMAAQKIFRHGYRKFSKAKATTNLSNMLFGVFRKPAEYALLLTGLWAAVEALNLPTEPLDVQGYVLSFVRVLVIFNLSWFLLRLVTILEVHASRHLKKQQRSRNAPAIDTNFLALIRKTVRIFIFLIAGLLIVQNLGYSISGLWASLGLGGLAVALAAKDTLGNLFAWFSLCIDRPFHDGDWVKAGDDLEGHIEGIGMRSTKIRTWEKSLIQVPNSTLAEMPINNFSRMQKRRIKTTIGLTYGTTADQVEEVVRRIRQMLLDHPGVHTEFLFVKLVGFGPSSLDIQAYFFTRTIQWLPYLDVQQEVMLKIMRILEDVGVEIAFPSRSIYVHHAEPNAQEGQFLIQ